LATVPAAVGLIAFGPSGPLAITGTMCVLSVNVHALWALLGPECCETVT
jgi:hypothetical protein